MDVTSKEEVEETVVIGTDVLVSLLLESIKREGVSDIGGPWRDTWMEFVLTARSSAMYSSFFFVYKYNIYLISKRFAAVALSKGTVQFSLATQKILMYV